MTPLDTIGTNKMLIKGKKSWSQKEDQTILSLVELHGASNWSLIASELTETERSGKQCRERYHNHLQANIKKGEWTKEEDTKIVYLQAKYGNQWAKITKELPGRTDNAIKNRWHAAIRSQARQQNDQGGTLSAPKSQRVSKSTLDINHKPSIVPALPLGSVCKEPETTGKFYYSPRYERDMLLAESIDLNYLSHCHESHSHEEYVEDVTDNFVDNSDWLQDFVNNAFNNELQSPRLFHSESCTAWMDILDCGEADGMSLNTASSGDSCTSSSLSSTISSTVSSLASDDEMCMLRLNPWTTDTSSGTTDYTDEEDDDGSATSAYGTGNEYAEGELCFNGMEDFALSSPKRSLEDINLNDFSWMVNMDGELMKENECAENLNFVPPPRLKRNRASRSPLCVGMV